MFLALYDKPLWSNNLGYEMIILVLMVWSFGMHLFDAGWNWHFPMQTLKYKFPIDASISIYHDVIQFSNTGQQ